MCTEYFNHTVAEDHVAIVLVITTGKSFTMSKAQDDTTTSNDEVQAEVDLAKKVHNSVITTNVKGQLGS